MGRGPKQTFFQRMHTDGQHAHMKRCSTSLITGEMQWKPQWDITSHLSEWKMSCIQRTKTKFKRGCGEKGTLVHSLWVINWYNHYGKYYGGSSEN